RRPEQEKSPGKAVDRADARHEAARTAAALEREPSPGLSPPPRLPAARSGAISSSPRHPNWRRQRSELQSPAFAELLNRMSRRKSRYMPGRALARRALLQAR